MMRLKLSACMVAFAVAMLTGCTLDPHYERPAAPVAVAYPKGEAYESTSAAASGTASGTATPGTTTTAPPLAVDVAWRSFFRDERLQRLIQIALDNNRDLRVAALNVAEYEAQYRITRAALAPSISASGSLTRERTSGVTSSSSDVSVGTTSWEIDFFGRLRSLKRQALENYLATDASRQSTQISLIATVATDYLTLLSDERLLQITEDTVKADQSTYDVTKRIQELGNSSMLDVQQAQNSLASAKASLASYRRAVAQDRNNLVAVLGAPIPDDLPPAREFDDETMFADIGAGVPSLLLTRRPDIVQAEHALKAANANIGAARAAFFPRVSLTGNFGTLSPALDGLFKSGSSAWAFVPLVSVPIFEGGANRANLDLAHVQADVQVAQYEKAIQAAFREVADGLAARGTYEQEIAARQNDAFAEQRRLELSDLRYRSGVDSYLSVLTAQKDLFAARQSLISAKVQRLTSLVDLYRALGGGWIEQSSEELRAADSGSRS